MDDIMEEWRDVVGYGGLYQISNLGRVRHKSGVVLDTIKTSHGYRQVALGRKRPYVHRLVAAAFHGLSTTGHSMQVHHKNGMRDDNRLENLEILTPSEHQHRDFVLRCSQLEPIGPGGGMSMFDRSPGYTAG